MSQPDWIHDEVAEKPPLNDAQVKRLMRMTEVLRDSANLLQAYHIKHAFECDDAEQIKALWEEFTEEEQIALYVAPKFGGIFTTAERKAIKTGVIE